MKKQYQNIFKIITISFLFLGFFGHVDAADFNATDVTPIVEFMGRTVNLLVSVSGTAFSIMILWSAYKYAMARGDPKAILGAKHTLTMAMMGVIIVVGFYTIMLIIGGPFGITSSITNPVDAMKSGFNDLIKAINQCNNNIGQC
jgi:hypothetical protein